MFKSGEVSARLSSPAAKSSHRGFRSSAHNSELNRDLIDSIVGNVDSDLFAAVVKLSSVSAMSRVSMAS